MTASKFTMVMTSRRSSFVLGMTFMALVTTLRDMVRYEVTTVRQLRRPTVVVSTSVSQQIGRSGTGTSHPSRLAADAVLPAITPPQTAAEALTFPQDSWRQWLDESFSHSPDSQDHSMTLDRFKLGSFHHPGCGFTLRLRTSTTAPTTSTSISNTKTDLFVKFSVTEDMNHHTAESHLREIKAAYLDRLLQLQVVAPCVGMTLEYDRLHNGFATNSNSHNHPNGNDAVLVQQQQQQQELYNHTRCARHPPVTNTLGVSVSLFTPGVALSTEQEVVEAARLYSSSSIPTTASARTTQLSRTESAFRYAIFVYLAGCVKSEHNHFDIDHERFISIDNDRCFTPEQFLEDKHQPRILELFQTWKRIVFDACQFPESLVRAWEPIMVAATTVPVRQQLQDTWQDDALAPYLSAEHPEQLREIDARVQRLWQHIQICRRSNNSNNINNHASATAASATKER